MVYNVNLDGRINVKYEDHYIQDIYGYIQWVTQVNEHQGLQIQSY